MCACVSEWVCACVCNVFWMDLNSDSHIQSYTIATAWIVFVTERLLWQDYLYAFVLFVLCGRCRKKKAKQENFYKRITLLRDSISFKSLGYAHNETIAGSGSNESIDSCWRGFWAWFVCVVVPRVILVRCLAPLTGVGKKGENRNLGTQDKEKANNLKVLFVFRILYVIT